MFKWKLKVSKERILGVYKGWLVRKLLKDEDIINRIMSIQDINAYIEELHYTEDKKLLEPAKKQRKAIISDFVSTVESFLNPIKDSDQHTRRLSIYNWANKINQKV